MPDLKRYPSEDIIKILNSLSRGDRIIVYWRDACGFRDVPVPEEIYYTPKTSLGIFYSIIEDHLIIISEETGRGESYEGTVIPIGIIEKIEVLKKGRKWGKRLLKQRMSILHGYPLKTVVETVKVCMHG